MMRGIVNEKMLLPWFCLCGPCDLEWKSENMSRILITGGAGFIGSNLAEQLVKAGREVVLLDVVEEPVNICAFEHRVEYVQQDVCDPKGMVKLMKEDGISGIVHLAAVSRVIWGEEDPELCKRTNVRGTQCLLDAVKKANKQPWIVFGSSREVYGEPTNFPVSEGHVKAPLNVYGRTKLEGERMVRKAAGELGLKSAILRFSNVYGNERDILDRVIPRFVLAGLKEELIEIHGGNQVIEFTHVDDTVHGIMLTMKALEEHWPCSEGNGNRYPNCDDFHLLPGHPVTLQETAETISDCLGADIPVNYTGSRTYDVDRFHGDPSKAERMLGFKAGILPEAGIRMTVKRFEEVMDL